MKYKKERKDEERRKRSKDKSRDKSRDKSKDRIKGKHSKSPKKKANGFGCAKTNSKNNAACNE